MPEFDDDINEFFEERAGILEHLAGLPRVMNPTDESGGL